ncbi:MAG: FecR domain-containing protein [Sandaracinaceae bacterium]|nr:FecR domain-containing protein [Sandaracinaceae bacterium]
MSRPELGQELDVKVDEARLARGWERVEARAFGPRRRGRAIALGAVGLAAAAALVALLVRERPWVGPGALQANGRPAEATLTVAAAAGDTVELDDGSRIRFVSASVVEPLENGGSRFSVLLERGEARFEVEPGGPRRWVIEAGHVTVEVVGTVFTVHRDDGEVRVDVERGRVLVRSEALEHRVRALGAGESVHVAAPPVASAPVPVEEPPGAAPPSVAPAIEPVAPPSTPPSTPPSVTETRPPAPTVPAEPRVAPAPGAASTAASLMASADEARRAGDVDVALERLGRAAALDGDPDAAIAAFTRGRLAVRHGRAGEAVRDFERALRLGLPAAIEESARYRLVGAHARAGDPTSARLAADDYLARYPEGAFRADVERDRP